MNRTKQRHADYAKTFEAPLHAAIHPMCKESPEILEALKKWSREGLTTYKTRYSRKAISSIALKAKYGSVSELLTNAEKIERWLGE